MEARNPNTLALASFVTKTRAQDLPREVSHNARRAVLDATGCALGGISTPLFEAVVASIRAQGGDRGVPLVGGALWATPALAALADAVAINALDFDDTYEDGTNPISHPGSSTIGALLAMLPTRPDLTLGDAVAAAAVGYEATIRVARAVQPEQERRDHVWGLGPHQVFGSAAVSARLLRLDLEQTLQCLGLAGVHTSVPSVWTASGWLKDAVGWPTMTGVLAGHLAANGFAGPRRILDGRRSYYATVASDRYRPDELTDGLGERWHLLDLSFKPYPACRWIHPVLDALTAMSSRLGQLEADEIEGVEVAGFWELEKLFLRYRPADLIDAQFSLPYTCAQVLLRTPPGPEWFTADRLEDEAALRLASRVTVSTDPAVEAARREDPSALQARVTLKLRDGRVLDDECAIAHGHPSDPLSDAELVAKFRVLAEPSLGSEASTRFAEAVLGDPSDTPAAAVFAGIL
ncbi:MmgE/PrpD family protein [soil metagenome]